MLVIPDDAVGICNYVIDKIPGGGGEEVFKLKTSINMRIDRY